MTGWVAFGVLYAVMLINCAVILARVYFKNDEDSFVRWIYVICAIFWPIAATFTMIASSYGVFDDILIEKTENVESEES